MHMSTHANRRGRLLVQGKCATRYSVKRAPHMSAREQILELKDRISRSIIGQQHVMERLLLALLCNGNVLIEAF